MIAAISSTARSNAASFAFDGFCDPLTLRTYCSAAARTSSSLTGGSKLWSVLMFLHMPAAYPQTSWTMPLPPERPALRPRRGGRGSATPGNAGSRHRS